MVDKEQQTIRQIQKKKKQKKERKKKHKKKTTMTNYDKTHGIRNVIDSNYLFHVSYIYYFCV